MKRLFPLVVIISLLVITASCSKKLPQQAEIQGRNVLTSLREITAAYENRELRQFMDKFSKDLPDRQAFSRSVDTVFDKYDTIRFTIQYPKLLILVDDRGRIKASFTWDGEWRTPAGKTVKDGSRVTLLFDPKGAWVQSIDGRNPFVPVEKQQ